MRCLGGWTAQRDWFDGELHLGGMRSPLDAVRAAIGAERRVRMPDRFRPPNRSDEYRHLAEEARAKAEAYSTERLRNQLLNDAQMWERMAEWEDKNNPRRPAPCAN